jgi:hypothetical protein
MRLRKLRIAWSAVWGLLALSLVILWVRSRFRVESIERAVNVQPLYAIGTKERIFNLPGRVELSVEHVLSDTSINYEPPVWHRQEYGMPERTEQSWGFKWVTSSQRSIICFPHWFAVALIGCVALLPWPPRRFTIRTLLIATTLVAIVLGLIVAAV